MERQPPHIHQFPQLAKAITAMCYIYACIAFSPRTNHTIDLIPINITNWAYSPQSLLSQYTHLSN